MANYSGLVGTGIDKLMLAAILRLVSSVARLNVELMMGDATNFSRFAARRSWCNAFSLSVVA